jgi:hypothetical protein
MKEHEMNSFKSRTLFAVAMTIALNLTLTNREIASATEAHLVRIWSVGGEEPLTLRIDPPVLQVDKNTIVLWMSGVKEEEIQIVFESGKVCRDVTANPNEKKPDFFLDAKNCYVTTLMPYADTSALEFPDAGTFEYIVQTNDGKTKAKGRIIVRSE